MPAPGSRSACLVDQHRIADEDGRGDDEHEAREDEEIGVPDEEERRQAEWQQSEQQQTGHGTLVPILHVAKQLQRDDRCGESPEEKAEAAVERAESRIPEPDADGLERIGDNRRPAVPANFECAVEIVRPNARIGYG